MARVIGVDVGGTKVAVASLEDGVLGEVHKRPTEKASPDALVDQLVEAIEAAGAADAVGLGIPSVIDAARGMAMSSVNIPLQHVPLRDILGRRLNMPGMSTTTRPSPPWRRRMQRTARCSPRRS